jgi:mRNA interferase RelE/StbE
MKVIISKAADKFISNLDKQQKQRFIQKFNPFVTALKNNDFPSIKEFDIVQLKGKLKGNYRLRIGDLRVVFRHDDSVLIIESIDYRGNVYK